MGLRRRELRGSSGIRRLGMASGLNCLNASAQSLTFDGNQVGTSFDLTGKTSVVVVCIGRGAQGQDGGVGMAGGGGGQFARTAIPGNTTSPLQIYSGATGETASGITGTAVKDGGGTVVCLAQSGLNAVGGGGGDPGVGDLLRNGGNGGAGSGLAFGSGGGGAGTAAGAGHDGAVGDNSAAGAGGTDGDGNPSGTPGGSSIAPSQDAPYPGGGSGGGAGDGVGAAGIARTIITWVG